MPSLVRFNVELRFYKSGWTVAAARITSTWFAAVEVEVSGRHTHIYVVSVSPPVPQQREHFQGALSDAVRRELNLPEARVTISKDVYNEV